MRRILRFRAGRTALPVGEFVALDTEATGLDPRRDAPVSVAAIPFVGGDAVPGRGFATLVNPGRPIPPRATRVHGLRDVDVASAPRPEDVLPALCACCRASLAIVGYHVGFDVRLLNRFARPSRIPRLTGPVVDVASLAGSLSAQWADLALEDLATLHDVPVEGRHTAIGDAVIAGRLYVKLVPLLRECGVVTLAELLRFQARRSRVHTTRPGAP